MYFAVIQLYILVLSFYLVAQAFSGGSLGLNVNNGVGGFFSSLFTSTSGLVLIALVSTYGIYIFASILYADPWHMITSSWAYFLGMPSSINVLMVYAFCNWHDVSWGTKGSDQVSSLPSAQTHVASGASSTNFVEEADQPQADIDTEFELTVRRALTPFKPAIEEYKADLSDSYKTFRTNLVLLWSLSNGLLVLLINNASVTNLCLTVIIPFPPLLIDFLTDILLEYIYYPHSMVLQGYPLGYFRLIDISVPWSAVVSCENRYFVLLCSQVTKQSEVECTCASSGLVPRPIFSPPLLPKVPLSLSFKFIHSSISTRCVPSLSS